ncbi:f-box domain-containing protein [Caerostris extrusa]|uniref:F-box domain-containing protein n=1 Tax=Caerostris extrusa TaxID=172846 RepID=A0AAV4Y2N9_CAEEX|nr:f-box domain-containing protein [Caerostris extrusa]
MLHINSLPIEILIRIFEYYCQADDNVLNAVVLSNVCRKWNEICSNSSLLHIFKGAGSLDDLKTYFFNGLFKNTEVLTLPRRENLLMKSELNLIYHNLPRLKSIDFTFVIEDFIKTEQCLFLSELSDKCPDLKKIVLFDFCCADYPQVATNHFDKFLIAHGFTLTCIDFSNVLLAGENLFFNIGSTCPNLEQLKALNLSKDSSLIVFPVEHMQESLPKLKELCLGYPIKLHIRKNLKAVYNFFNRYGSQLTRFGKSPKIHKCNQCSYTTVYSTGLQRHILTHTREKPFMCGKRFTQKGNLQCHLRIHKKIIMKNNLKIYPR